MLCVAQARPSPPTVSKQTRRSTRTPPHPTPSASKPALALPALAAGFAAAQLALLPPAAQALDDARVAPPPRELHRECVARRHARAAAACVSSLARPVDAAPALVEAEADGEPSKAAILAERRQRIAGQVTVLADGALKMLGQSRGAGAP